MAARKYFIRRLTTFFYSCMLEGASTSRASVSTQWHAARHHAQGDGRIWGEAKCRRADGPLRRLGIVMSALPPKADIETQSRDVRFVPKADIAVVQWPTQIAQCL